MTEEKKEEKLGVKIENMERIEVETIKEGVEEKHKGWMKEWMKRGKKGGGCLRKRRERERESLCNRAPPICILWGCGLLYNGPIKRNNVVYETRPYLLST